MIVYEGIDLIGKLLAGSDYRINMMYMEFRNGGLPAPVYTVDPAQGRAYYQALDAGTGATDYIRVPLIATPTLTSSDATKFLTNRLTVLATSFGKSAGQGGQAFSSVAGSVVFGVALVAAPDPNDATQDLVYSRSYDFTAIVKRDNEEVSILWPHTLAESLSSSST